MRHRLMRTQSDATSFLDILLAGGFIFANEVLGSVASKPIGHFGKFFTKTIDGL